MQSCRSTFVGVDAGVSRPPPFFNRLLYNGRSDANKLSRRFGQLVKPDAQMHPVRQKDRKNKQKNENNSKKV